jgi:nitrogenase molybdenum-iron protein alpha chain
MNLTASVEAPSREERLGSITGYVGTIKDLNSHVQSGTLQNRGRCFSQATSCPNMCAVGSLAEIRDAAVIYHAPVGCMSGAAQQLWLVHKVNDRRGTETNAQLLGTELGESDTILGAADKLEAGIIETYRRYNPKAIFIAATCVSGIIGEDLEAVANKAEEQLPIPVIPVHCEGFKSGIWATGFDASDHAILTRLVKPPQQKRNVVNFKNFRESARTDIIDMFRQIGVDDVQFLYSTISTEDIAHLSEARATVCICSTLGTYMGNGLQELYGVPYIQTLNPVGIAGFEEWLREIGRVIGETDKVEAYIARERAEWMPKIEEAKKQLKGLRVVIGMGSSFAFQVARVVQELGMEVAYALAWHLDPEYDNGDKSKYLKHLAETTTTDFGISVADQQNYELYTVLNKYKPDLYLGRHPGNVIWAIKQGIPSLFMVEEYTTFGYRRYYRFIHTLIDLLSNRSFADKLASKITLPYSDWWYKQEYDTMYEEV